MKKYFSLFGFASLLLLSFAFTPAEIVVEETAEVCTEVASEVCAEKEMMFGAVDFYSCAITAQIPPPGSIVYRFSGANGGYQDVVDCDWDNFNLAPGSYDLYVRSTDVQAYIYYRWQYCGMQGSGNVLNVGPSTVPVSVGTFVIPC